MHTEKGTIKYIHSTRVNVGDHTFDFTETITVDFELDIEKQLMSYTVTTNRPYQTHLSKIVKDVPYSYTELHLAAVLFLFRKMYFGLPDLRIEVIEGELANNSNGIFSKFTG